MDLKQEFNKELNKSFEAVEKAKAAPLPEGVVIEITDIEHEETARLYRIAGEHAKKKKKTRPK